MLAWDYVREAVAPLRFVFWGGLLLILDFTITQTTNGQGFRCDILDDTVGALLIAVGVFRLSAAPVDERYAKVMRFVKVVCVLGVVETAIKHFVFEQPGVLGFYIFDRFEQNVLGRDFSTAGLHGEVGLVGHAFLLMLSTA